MGPKSSAGSWPTMSLTSCSFSSSMWCTQKNQVPGPKKKSCSQSQLLGEGGFVMSAPGCFMDSSSQSAPQPSWTTTPCDTVLTPGLHHHILNKPPNHTQRPCEVMLNVYCLNLASLFIHCPAYMLGQYIDSQSHKSCK